MSSGASPGEPSPPAAQGARGAPRPDWADGLRQLYDSVVDEPLPDSFRDLLDRLDDSRLDTGRLDTGRIDDGTGEAATNRGKPGAAGRGKG